MVYFKALVINFEKILIIKLLNLGMVAAIPSILAASLEKTVYLAAEKLNSPETEF